jgi:hypothetical protein
VPLCGQIEVGGTAGNDTAARKKNTNLRGHTVVSQWNR